MEAPEAPQTTAHSRKREAVSFLLCSEPQVPWLRPVNLHRVQDTMPVSSGSEGPWALNLDPVLFLISSPLVFGIKDRCVPKHLGGNVAPFTVLSFRLLEAEVK